MRPSKGLVHRAGVHYVIAELNRRGVEARPAKSDKGIDIHVPKQGTKPALRLRVKAKTDAFWQTSTEDRLVPHARPETNYVVFVTFGWGSSDSPTYWVAPESWVKRDVYTHHRAYLAEHGGKRPRTPGSTHHSVDVTRVEKWRDRWDLLGVTD